MFKFAIGILVLTASVGLAAQPAQRIIVGFETTLTENTKLELENTIESILGQTLILAESSNDQRWVVILNDRLNAGQLQDLIEKIEALPNIRYAEVDALMRAN